MAVYDERVCAIIDMAIRAKRRWDTHPQEPQQLVSARSEGAGIMT